MLYQNLENKNILYYLQFFYHLNFDKLNYELDIILLFKDTNILFFSLNLLSIDAFFQNKNLLKSMYLIIIIYYNR